MIALEASTTSRANRLTDLIRKRFAFRLGTVELSPRLKHYTENHDSFNPMDCLARHMNGDWGSVSEDLVLRNMEHLGSDRELVSRYPTPGGTVTVITNGRRTRTRLQLS